MANEFVPDVDVVAAEFMTFPVATLLATEGNLTVAETNVSQSGAKDKTHTYASEMSKGFLVVSSAALTVSARATETTSLGVTHTNPSHIEGLELAELLVVGVNASPTLRYVQVEIFGLVVRKVVMESGQTALVGASVLYSTAEPNNFAAATAGNGTYVLVGATGGNEALVIFLHQGVLA